MVSKVFEKLVDRLKKCGLFSDFQYDFRSSQSTADLLTIVPDRTASAFDRSRATRAVPFYISKAFDSVCMLVYFTNVNLMEFQVRYLVLFLHLSVIDGLEWFWMESLHKNIQLMLEFLKGPFLVIIFSYCILITFLMMLSVILLSMLMVLLSILSVIRHGMWQELELASELESDLRDTVDWGNGSIDVKMDGSVLEEKIIFLGCWG